MNRREFLKLTGAAIVALSAANIGLKQETSEAGVGDCRIVVFGSDGLRIDYANTLRNSGAPALSRLYPPICAECGGATVTQPGWASIMSGLPSEYIQCWTNDRFRHMPDGAHVFYKWADLNRGEDNFAVWVTGKGPNIKGNIYESPHWMVYAAINAGYPGIYHGDQARENAEVFDLGAAALQQAIMHDNFLAFVHFRDPDHTGHEAIYGGHPDPFGEYMRKALEVDQYVSQLMDLLPLDTKVIYCSDHGFDFKVNGDCQDHHGFSPSGTLATNFPVADIKGTSQMSIARLIVKLSGGTPDCTKLLSGFEYRMLGEDLV